MNNTKWFSQPGDQGGIVLSSRIRLARNIQGYPFPKKLPPEQRQELSEQLKDHILATPHPLAQSLGYFSWESLSNQAKNALAERHLIPRDFSKGNQHCPLLLSQDESVCILLGHQDHLHLQVLQAGLQLTEAFSIANRLDDMINEGFAYAFDKQWGYLTACPTDLGSGMVASVLLHLPALEATGEIQTLAGAVGKIGLRFGGTFGTSTPVSGSLYQLSNQISMGLTEAEALENLKSVTLQIIQQEQAAREELSPLETENTAFRALGLLQNARILPVHEFTSALSHLRLGVSMGLVPTVSLETLNTLNATMYPATLLLEHPEMNTTEKRDVIRAILVREQLQ